jgi:hypothetical protein
MSERKFNFFQLISTIFCARVARWVIFKPKIPIPIKIWRALECKILLYFMNIWNILPRNGIHNLLPSGIICCHLVYFYVLVCLKQEKSGSHVLCSEGRFCLSLKNCSLPYFGMYVEIRRLFTKHFAGPNIGMYLFYIVNLRLLWVELRQAKTGESCRRMLWWEHRNLSSCTGRSMLKKIRKSFNSSRNYFVNVCR